MPSGSFLLSMKTDDIGALMLEDVSLFLFDFNALHTSCRIIVDRRLNRDIERFDYLYIRRRYMRDRLYTDHYLTDKELLRVTKLSKNSPFEVAAQIMVATAAGCAGLWALTQTIERITSWPLNREKLRLDVEKARADWAKSAADRRKSDAEALIVEAQLADILNDEQIRHVIDLHPMGSVIEHHARELDHNPIRPTEMKIMYIPEKAKGENERKKESK